MMYSDIPSKEELQGEVSVKKASGKVMQATPLVTVVTVCFNPLRDGRKALLAKNLESVQQQRDVTLEHLIVDGGSDDGTLEFLQQYNNVCHDIRILSKPDSSIYEAMNRGIALAWGKYVVFLNSDDYYHRSDGLALSAKALEGNDCSFSFAPVLPKGPHTRFTHYHHPQRRLHKVFVTSVIPHPSMLYRRTALMEMGGYDLAYKLAGDYDMTLRLISNGHKGCFVNHCFATFVVGGFSTQDKNHELDVREKTRIVKNAHVEAFGIELTEQESEFLVTKGYYPRKYLSVYIASQQLVRRAFCGLPKGLACRIARRFNYFKYYLKCILDSDQASDASTDGL